MARTKQTVVKSTSGRAPKKLLASRASRKTVPGFSGKRKAYRYRPGDLLVENRHTNYMVTISVATCTVALREICQIQKKVEPILKMGPMQRLVHQIANEVRPLGSKSGNPFRWTPAAVDALRHAADAFLTRELESKCTQAPWKIISYLLCFCIVTQYCTVHAKRVTIQVKDMRLVDTLRQLLGGQSYNDHARQQQAERRSH
jgi:histone H3